MTHRERMQAVLDRITFTPALQAFAPRLVVETARKGRALCMLELTFPERSTGAPFDTRTPFVVRSGATPDEVGRAVVGALVQQLTHEARETVMVDGVLVDDPHPLRSSQV